MDVIYQYTRADAIADGVLIDVTARSLEAGIRYSVAVTSGVWSECVHVSAVATGQDETGRLWDVVMQLRHAILRSMDGSRIDFKVLVQGGVERGKEVSLYALCHPGDSGEPVITVMLPHED